MYKKILFILSFILFGLSILASSIIYPALMTSEITLNEAGLDVAEDIGELTFGGFTMVCIIWSVLMLCPIFFGLYSIRMFKVSL